MSEKFNAEEFLNVEILTPLEQNQIRGGFADFGFDDDDLQQQQQQQQQQQNVRNPPKVVVKVTVTVIAPPPRG